MPVVTVKPAVVCPAGIARLAGTLATDGLLLVSATVAPPAGAAAFNVTVAEDAAPAAIEFEGNVTALTELAAPALSVFELPPLPLLESPPVGGVPPPDGDPENVLPGVAPQPISIINARSATAGIGSALVPGRGRLGNSQVRCTPNVTIRRQRHKGHHS